MSAQAIHFGVVRIWCVMLINVLLATTTSGQSSPAPSEQVITAGPVEMSIGVDKTQAQIADPILLRIQVEAPAGTSITFPVVTDRIGPLSVVDSDTIGDLPLEGAAARRRWTRTIELESLQSGDVRIPPLEVLYRLPESIADAATARDGSLQSEPISIEIISVLEDGDMPTQYRDIKDTAELPLAEHTRSNQSWWLIGATFVLLVAIASACWLRRGKKLRPARWALEEIDQIESGFREQTVDVASVYSQLSFVLRRYLQVEMAFPATSLSSEELLAQLSNSGCPDAAWQRLQRFVTESDEMKYSGRIPSATDHDESPFDSVRVIVRETSQVAMRPANQGNA